MRVPTAGTLVDACWWPHEKRLAAPKALLEWLIHNAAAPASEAAWGSTETRRKRESLVRKEPEGIAEALRMLSTTTDDRAWWILEGRTCPDVYLETDAAVVVIEGKRTEAGPTTHTSWMPVRHQMLRHLDAALEIARSRRLVGFFIVESATPDVPAHWREAVAATISPDALVRSLPHRSADDRTRIADAFLGATTWAAVCDGLSIPRAVLIDDVVAAKEAV